MSFWHRLPDLSRNHRLSTPPSPPEAPAAPEAGPVDHGILRLSGTQLLGTHLEGSDLVIDAFGGSGTWTGFTASEEVVEEGQVSGTPMLTFRASFDYTIDICALERLLHWSETACHVDLVVDVDGDSPLQIPTRITITDHAQAVSLLTASV
ncbi:MAG: hypothetical protein QOK43_385 [Acidimicrobiaceae bacterium]|nr:hypothetical protein [Acidimicrobiaceae bacterium]